jgi:signal transduction histidine kinase
MLQIQDASGRILSSGHFRNEYDRLEPALPVALRDAPGRMALVQARRPEGPFLALAGIETFRLGPEILSLIGGTVVEETFLSGLSRDEELAVSLVYPGGAESSDEGYRASLVEGVNRAGWTWGETFPRSGFFVETMEIPFAGTDGELASAVLIASHSRRPLRQLMRRLDAWLLVVLAGAALGTFLLARWTAARVSRPLEELARKTLKVDLGRSEADFSSTRGDEVGELSRFLDAMMRRLRNSAQKLRDAERRAALGELARQVNHDVKNGLLPLRNVFRHLSEVTRDRPADLKSVFDERRGVLDKSIGYLENLAGNYARLYRSRPRERCDLNDVVRQVAASREGEPEIVIRVRLSEAPAAVMADPLALHRIVENLTANAVESVSGSGGTVTLATEVQPDVGDGRVQLVVADTGPGISEEQRVRIFDDFYTTKEQGVGLGLSIVRRMVADCEGEIRVVSAPGEGARFVVLFPAAGDEDTGGRNGATGAAGGSAGTAGAVGTTGTAGGSAGGTRAPEKNP